MIVSHRERKECRIFDIAIFGRKSWLKQPKCRAKESLLFESESQTPDELRNLQCLNTTEEEQRNGVVLNKKRSTSRF